VHFYTAKQVTDQYIQVRKLLNHATPCIHMGVNMLGYYYHIVLFFAVTLQK